MIVGVVNASNAERLNQLKLQGVPVINTTSRSKDWSQGLSPFFLGPVPLYDGFVASNVENAWQYSKVYSEHLDVDGDPSEKYWKWAKEGWAKDKAVRYPMGKGAIPEYSYWDGKKYDYITARRKIYIPIYIKKVVPTHAFKKLKHICTNYPLVYLWDFDGRDYLKEGITIKEAVYDSRIKFGHAMVLAMVLTMSKREILEIIED